jgi:hypothetical protein
MFCAIPGAARAQNIDDKGVQLLMRQAFSMLPDKFTMPDQKIIRVDRRNPDEFMIPLDDARRVIRVAYNSARAQVCKIFDKQTENHRALMQQERDSKKWTDKQLLFINQLHLFIIQFTVGNVKWVSNGTDSTAQQATTAAQQPKVSEEKPPQPCTDDEKKALIEKIDAYVKGQQAG